MTRITSLEFGFGKVQRLLIVLLLCIAPALTAATQRIAGQPLTIDIADDTSFQVRNANVQNGQGQIFPAACTTGADSGVFAAVGGVLYAPDFQRHAPCPTAVPALRDGIPWTPVSISTVSGTGTSADPLRVVVIADAGTTGIRLTATYSYVNGEELFRLTTSFCTAGIASLNVYLAADLYLATSDDGTPYLEPASQSPGGRTCSGPPYTILLVPITAADSYAAADYAAIWSAIGARGRLSGTIGSGCIDNGAALHWRREVPAGGCTTIESMVSFGAIPRIEPPADETVACCLAAGCVDLPPAECTRRGGAPGARNSACIARRPAPADPTHDMFVPREWAPKLSDWIRDRNRNFVDDGVDAFPAGQSVPLLVCLNRATRDEDVAWLATRGTVGYVSRYLPIVELRAAAGTAAAIAADPRVSHVELDRPFYPTTDVTVPSVRVAPSAVYSPSTWEEACPTSGGAGVNIAVIDSGVDDSGGPGTPHVSLPAAAFAYDAVTDTMVNPDDVDGHGTHVAAIALGRPTVSGGKTYRGVASKAGLIDIRVYSTPPISGTALQKAFTVVLQKRAAWNINVVNMSFGDCTQSDGKDGASQYVNAMRNAGITVVTSMGNAGSGGCPAPGSVLVQGPAAADGAIAVQAASNENTIHRADDVLRTAHLRGPRTSDNDLDTFDEQKPDVAAPGTVANSGANAGVASAQLNTTSGYVRKGGTSMAAPHVAGMAALLMSAKPSLKTTPAVVKELLRATAEDRGTAPGWDGDWGMGLLDAFAGCQAATSTPVTDLQFTAHCGSPGSLAWTSPDLFPGVNPITEGQANTINATIRNGGTGNAGPFKVELGYYDLSTAANPYYVVKTVDVPGLAKGSTIVVSAPWTPTVSLTTGTAHACLVGKIIYPNDAQPANDCARRNVSIVATGSPARFRFALVNPTDEPLRVQLEHSFGVCPSGGWNLTLPTAEIVLASGAPPRVIDVALEPDGQTRGARVVSVVAVGTRPNGETLNLGGVSLVAQTPGFPDCNGNGAADTIDITLGPSRDVNRNRIPDECERRRRAVRHGSR